MQAAKAYFAALQDIDLHDANQIWAVSDSIFVVHSLDLISSLTVSVLDR